MQSKARGFATLANRLTATMDLEDGKVYINDLYFGANSSSDIIDNLVTTSLSTFYLSEVEDVSTENAAEGQVLTVTADGKFNFQNNAAREIHSILDLGILDGAANTILTAKGDSTFEFLPAEVQIVDYEDVTNTPSIPSSLTDLGLTGTEGQVLTANSSGGFEFRDPDTLNAIIMSLALG